MNENYLKTFAIAVKLILEADKFHVRVAKAFLSPTPLSGPEKQQLRDDLAKRESNHEQLEMLLSGLVDSLRDKPS